MKAKASKGYLNKKNLKVDITIGANLRFHREAANITQQELANALGISFQQIQKYEKGANRIACSTLLMIGDFLDISILSFFDDLGKIKKPPKSGLLSKEEIEVALLYKNCDPSARKSVKKILKNLSMH